MRMLLVPAAVAAMLVLAACGGGSGSPASGPATTSSGPGSGSFSTANVSGLGSLVVDGKGRTVYVLTSATTKNVPCTVASGCTAVWHPAGGYKGWRVYEYTGDSGRGQANGQGIKSFGGTWYALNASGKLVKSSSTGGYGYP